MILFVTVGVVTSIGLALDWLTLPRIDQIQSYVSQFVFDSQAYQAWAGGSPTGALIFNALYQVFWFVLTLEMGYPSTRDILLAPFSLLAMGLFRWFTFAVFGEWVARRLGGTAKPRAFWVLLVTATAVLAVAALAAFLVDRLAGPLLSLLLG